jgi:hypothetical protein
VWLCARVENQPSIGGGCILSDNWLVWHVKGIRSPVGVFRAFSTIIIIIIIKNFVCSPKGFSAYNYNMQFKIKLYYAIKNLSYDCLLKPSYI